MILAVWPSHMPSKAQTVLPLALAFLIYGKRHQTSWPLEGATSLGLVPPRDPFSLF